MRLQLRTIVGFVAAGSLISVTANAAVINVPGDFASIQDAIEFAACGDEIVVAPGTYNEAIDFIGKAITVRSSGGPEVTAIDGTGLGLGLGDRIVKCINGEGPSTVLRGFTITGGGSPEKPGASGMLNDNSSSPTVSHCILDQNIGGDGTGMLNVNNSNPWVENCTFSDNRVVVGGARHGAGMENGGSSPTVISCTFIGNEVSGGSSNIGGGMTNFGGSNPLVKNCTFAGNIADEGGAIWNSPDSLPVVTGSSFCQNSPDDIFGPWTDGGANVFGKCPSVGCPWDLNGDGVVDAADLAIVLTNWGTKCP